MTPEACARVDAALSSTSRPVAGEQRAEQPDRLGGEPGCAGRRDRVGDHAAELRHECGVRPRLAGDRAVAEARRPSGDRQRAQQVGVQRQRGAVLTARERPERADEQQVLLQRRPRP